jgi:uncharacterized membrane protein
MMATGLYDWLLFGHVLAAMVWLGGGVMLAALAVASVRGNDPAAVARLVSSLRVVGPAVLAPATVGTFGLGLWMVLDSGAWDFGQTWIQLALVLFAAAFVVGVAHQARTALAADRAIAAGDDGEARRQLVRWTWGYALVVLLLVVIAWDMTFKPGL